jgi:hypothetical protein
MLHQFLALSLSIKSASGVSCGVLGMTSRSNLVEVTVTRASGEKTRGRGFEADEKVSPLPRRCEEDTAVARSGQPFFPLPPTDAVWQEPPERGFGGAGKFPTVLT